MKTLRILLLALVAQAICAQGAFAATRTWLAAVNGDWATGANWSGGVAPTSADDVIIPSIGAGNYEVTIIATAAQCRTLIIGGGAGTGMATLHVTGTLNPAITVFGDAGAGVDVTIDAKGRWYNQSTAAAGNVIVNTAVGNTTLVKNNGILKHDSVRSLLGSFPAPGANGGTTFEVSSLLELGPLFPLTDQIIGAAVNLQPQITINGYVYGNIHLIKPTGPAVVAPQEVAKWLWTGSGAVSPTTRIVAGTLSIDADTTLTSTAGATSPIRLNNIVNSGGIVFGGAFDGNTAERGHYLTGNPSVFSGPGIYRIAGTLAIPTGSTLQLDSALTVAGGTNFALQCNPLPITGTGSINALSNASLRIQHTGGFDGQFSGLPALPTTAPGTNYRFGGPAAMVTGASMPTVAANVTFLTNAGVTLSGPLTVNSTAAFTSGTVTTSPTNKLTVGPATAPTRGKGHVIGDGYSQTLRGGVAAGSTRTMHVGTGADYTPVVVTLAGVGSTTNTLHVKTVASQHPDVTDPTKAIGRYWSLEPGGSLGVFTSTLVFTYLSADLATLAPGVQEFALRAERRNGLVWEVPTGTTNATLNTTTATGVTAFSDWTIEAVAVTDADPIWQQYRE